MKKVLLILMLLPLFLFAETSQNKKSNEEFSEIFFSLEVGEIYPFFELSDVLDNAVYGQGDLTYQYWKQLLGYLQFGYSYFKVTDERIDFPGVHQFHGRVGLLWKLPFVSSLKLGGGFSCIWARSDGGDRLALRGGMLSDNESEFGFHGRLNFPVFQLPNWNLGFNAYFEQLWTKPERSQMLWFGIYLKRRGR